jgi:hypothetical protein
MIQQDRDWAAVPSIGDAITRCGVLANDDPQALKSGYLALIVA